METSLSIWSHSTGPPVAMASEVPASGSLGPSPASHSPLVLWGREGESSAWHALCALDTGALRPIVPGEAQPPPRRVSGCPPRCGAGAQEAPHGAPGFRREGCTEPAGDGPPRLPEGQLPRYLGVPCSPWVQPPARTLGPAGSLAPCLSGRSLPPAPPYPSAPQRKSVPLKIELATRFPVETGHFETGASTPARRPAARSRARARSSIAGGPCR